MYNVQMYEICVKYTIHFQRSDPSLANKDGETALHVCVREGYAHGSWILITMLGISSIHVPNAQGVTPVDLIKQFEFSKKEGYAFDNLILVQMSIFSILKNVCKYKKFFRKI